MKGISFDRNGTTLKGLEEISKQITGGITLTDIALPVIDISRQFEELSKSTDIERLKDVSVEIEEKLRFYTQCKNPTPAKAATPATPTPQEALDGKKSPPPSVPMAPASTGSSDGGSVPEKSDRKDKYPAKIKNVDYLVKKYPEIVDVAPANDDLLLSTGLFSQLSNGLIYSEDI